MMGKFLAAFTVISALVVGASVYYLQVYAYYEEIPANGETDVQLTRADGIVEPILYEDFHAIDSGSSPIRYRACFTTSQSIAMMSETYEVLDKAEPRVAPEWFDCFDAEAIGADIEAGTAVAFMGTKDIHYGIDRIVAIYPDGRGYAWHQINKCGEVVFDGKPAPEGCPTPPEGTN